MNRRTFRKLVALAAILIIAALLFGNWLVSSDLLHRFGSVRWIEWPIVIFGVFVIALASTIAAAWFVLVPYFAVELIMRAIRERRR